MWEFSGGWWLGFWALTSIAQVQSLGGELRSWQAEWCGQKKKKKT